MNFEKQADLPADLSPLKKGDEKTYHNSLGVMDPDSTNVVPTNPDYYKLKSDGLIYYKED